MLPYEALRLLAQRVMAQPGQGLREPNTNFAGYGFSLSTPHHLMRANMRNIPMLPSAVAQPVVGAVTRVQARDDTVRKPAAATDDECQAPPCTPIQT
jgi:hypothetical protein